MAKIMLVEDDSNLREIYGARLMAEGYEIIAAADGEEALALAVKEKPDLIVADVMMPKISGFDMLDILRTTPETKNTKVIIMTALSQPEDRQRGESLGADKYLVKSQVTLEDVVIAVHDVLGDGGGTTTQIGTGPPQPPAAPPAPAATDQPASSPTNDNNMDQTNPPASAPEPPADDNLPKVEGATDAPEPASRKPKIIAPINDLSHEKDKLMQLVEEEEAKEAQSTPGSDITPSSEETNVNKAMAESMAEEKAQMEEDVKKLVNNGAIDDEAAAPTVDPAASPEPVADELPTDQPAASSPSAAVDSNLPADSASQSPTPPVDSSADDPPLAPAEAMPEPSPAVTADQPVPQTSLPPANDSPLDPAIAPAPDPGTTVTPGQTPAETSGDTTAANDDETDQPATGVNPNDVAL